MCSGLSILHQGMRYGLFLIFRVFPFQIGGWHFLWWLLTCIWMEKSSELITTQPFLHFENPYSMRSEGSRTLVRPDISSNWQKIEQMSGRTNVLQPFWHLLKLWWKVWIYKMANHSFEILLQIKITCILNKFKNLDFAGVFFYLNWLHVKYDNWIIKLAI